MPAGAVSCSNTVSGSGQYATWSPGAVSKCAVIWNLADLIYNFVYFSLHIFEVFTANFLIKIGYQYTLCSICQ